MKDDYQSAYEGAQVNAANEKSRILDDIDPSPSSSNQMWQTPVNTYDYQRQWCYLDFQACLDDLLASQAKQKATAASPCAGLTSQGLLDAEVQLWTTAIYTGKPLFPWFVLNWGPPSDVQALIDSTAASQELPDHCWPSPVRWAKALDLDCANTWKYWAIARELFTTTASDMRTSFKRPKDNEEGVLTTELVHTEHHRQEIQLFIPLSSPLHPYVDSDKSLEVLNGITLFVAFTNKEWSSSSFILTGFLRSSDFESLGGDTPLSLAFHGRSAVNFLLVNQRHAASNRGHFTLVSFRPTAETFRKLRNGAWPQNVGVDFMVSIPSTGLQLSTCELKTCMSTFFELTLEQYDVKMQVEMRGRKMCWEHHALVDCGRFPEALRICANQLQTVRIVNPPSTHPAFELTECCGGGGRSPE